MFKIYPYKVASKSVRALRDSLSGVVIKLENSRYRYRPGHVVINWGNSRRAPSLEGVDVLNAPEAVAVSVNKLQTLQQLSENEVATVPFTTQATAAKEWADGGFKVFVRETLNGHSGEGIQVIQSVTNAVLSEEQQNISDILLDVAVEAEEMGQGSVSIGLRALQSEIEPEGMTSSAVIPPAPLYTRGVANDGEYRVHVFDGSVILYQKKSRRVDDNGEVVTADGAEADVRNLESNWIYRTGNLRQLERVEELAINAVSALNLDFGAVDIIKDTEGNVFVLEVNSAPGLGNTATLEAYREAFSNLE